MFLPRFELISLNSLYALVSSFFCLSDPLLCLEIFMKPTPFYWEDRGLSHVASIAFCAVFNRPFLNFSSILYHVAG